MRICWIIFLVSFVSENSHATDNAIFTVSSAECEQVVLAFFVSLSAFSSHFLATKLDTILLCVSIGRPTQMPDLARSCGTGFLCCPLRMRADPGIDYITVRSS